MYAPVATTMNPGTIAIATTNTGTTIALVVATMINNALALKTGLKVGPPCEVEEAYVASRAQARALGTCLITLLYGIAMI